MKKVVHHNYIDGNDRRYSVATYTGCTLEEVLEDFTGLPVEGEANPIKVPQPSLWKRFWAWAKREIAIGGK